MTNFAQTYDEPALSLRVAEALPKDVGRGVVRLDPKDIRRLGAQIGEIVQLTGEGSSLGRLLPAYPAERGRSLIQMDSALRANAGAQLDAQVRVARVAAVQAYRVRLAPEDPQRLRAAGEEESYLAQLLHGVPVLAGNQVRVNLFGFDTQSFTVAETQPEGPVIIGGSTQIEVSGAPVAPVSATTSYADIGGLHREVRRVREMIEMPLRYPELFDRLGISPPKGVLLHGPPGCGKTLIARAIAHETSAAFFHVNGPEIMDQWYGASEAHLRKIFEQAQRRAPAIIFLDEIDSIAPKREEMSGERQIERRVVAQLLTLMDGLEPRGNVVVIAATNIPDVLDPALRRPGRFDREITISAPDAEGRREILAVHTRGMPLADDVDLDRLAAVTHGFVGADLAALVREAAMGALRHVLTAPAAPNAQLYAKLRALRVSGQDFASALKEIDPSALRDVHVELPDVSWDDIGGLDSIKQALAEAVEWPLRHPDLFEAMGVRPIRGVLLHGAPGTGKTLLAKALARQSEVNFIAIKGPQLLSRWVGESERALRDVFRKARQSAPCLIFFDEIDALAPPRGEDASQASDRLVGQLLTELDGISDLQGVVVVAATNRVDRVDEALLRPGRFDLLLELPAPDRRARLAILRVQTRKIPLAGDVRLEAIADATEGYVGADLAGLCQRAALMAIRELVEARAKGAERDPARTARQAAVGQHHFTAALKA